MPLYAIYYRRHAAIFHYAAFRLYAIFIDISLPHYADIFAAFATPMAVRRLFSLCLRSLLFII